MKSKVDLKRAVERYVETKERVQAELQKLKEEKNPPTSETSGDKEATEKPT